MINPLSTWMQMRGDEFLEIEGAIHWMQTATVEQMLGTEGRRRLESAMDRIAEIEARAGYPFMLAPTGSAEGDWTPWEGGACPVTDDVYIDFYRRSGEVVLNVDRASDFNWGRYSHPVATDILGWRLSRDRRFGGAPRAGSGQPGTVGAVGAPDIGEQK